MAKETNEGIFSKAGKSAISNGSTAMNDHFSDQPQDDMVDDTAADLTGKAQQGVEDLKETPQNIKNTYNNIKSIPQKAKNAVNAVKSIPSKIRNMPNAIKNKASNAYNAVKNLPGNIKKAAVNTGKAIKNTAKNAYNAGKAVVKAVAHPIQTLKNLPQNLAKAVQNLNPKKLLDKLNPRKWLDKINPIKRIQRRIQKTIEKVKKTVERVKKTIKFIQKAVKLAIKAIKAAIKIAKTLLQVAIKVIQALIQLIIATWPIWLIVLVLGIIIGAIWYFLDNDSTMDNKSLDNEKSEYNESTINSDGNAEMTTISGNTKVIEAFYQYFAEKSIWVVYDGVVYNDDKLEHDDELGDVYTPLQRNTEAFNEKFMDENGEVILKDYQDRETMFYINPNALFVYDKYLHGEQIRFPEQIVQHVAYDYYPSTLQGQDVNETNDKKCLTEFEAGNYDPNYNKFILKQLTDDESRILTITSQKYKGVAGDSSEVSEEFKNDPLNASVSQVFIPDGDEKIEGVWDYGLGSIMHYVKYLVKHENRGIYENFEVWDMTMQMDTATGLKYYGEVKEFPTYEDYDADTNHDNYDATDIAELEGDDRKKVYTAENAPTDEMKEFLADEDTFFIDWVVTPAGDISNSVTYEWKDTGNTFTYPEPFDKEVERFDEKIEWRHEKRTTSVSCGGSKTVACRKRFKVPCRNNIDDEPMYAPEETTQVSNSCEGCDEGSHDEDYWYYWQVIEEVYVDVDVTFNADVNGTTWDKAPFYDGSPYAQNISGRRYYEDYMTHYETYVPHNVTGFFDLEDMLKRIQLNITDPDLEEELTKILQRSEMKNGGANSLAEAGSGYTLGAGANEFEQLYNGSARETIDRIWDGLVSWGYSEEQAAAMLGNIFQESRFKTDVVNNIGASGLCQWLNGRKTQLDSFAGSVNNTSWTDLNTQIQFMCMELDTYKYTWASYQWAGNESYHSTFLNSSDPSEIAIAVMRGWERSGESETSASALTRSSVAGQAYSMLAGKEIEYPIDKIASSVEAGSLDGDASGSGGGNIFTSIWNWLKSVGDKIKSGIKELFGFEDEYYDIMTEKERYHLIYHSVAEEDVDYVLQSIFAYTDNQVISKYYLELTDEFFIQHFTELFSNPIGTSWSSANAKESDKTALSNYMGILQENYPDGFEIPLDECILSGTDSDYGLYVKATDGQNCYAVCDGTITVVSEDTRYGGKYIVLDNGVSETIYGHLKDVNVSLGQDVSKGDVIATVSGDEMFFGITNEYKAIVDPSFILHRLISDGTLGSEIAAYGCQFVGYPYVFGGSWNGEIPYTSTDCSGFVSGLFRHFGVMNSRSTSSVMATMGVAITQDELMPGDVICYKTPGGSVHHVALYIGNGEIVHAKGENYGIVISSMNSSSDIKICRRYIGI